jgi:hypothetical protein
MILASAIPQPVVRLFVCLRIRLAAICASWRFIFLLAMLLVLCGCGADTAAPGLGPFGAPAESRLLAPLAGRWEFVLEQTLEAQKAGGATDEQIENLRKLYAGNTLLGKMHPDITIKGNEAVCTGMPAAEYRFFAMHEHDGKLCGKAWHHEDRFDPGDMSKCYVRFKLEDDRLVFELRMQEDMDLNDPDLRTTPSPDSGSAAACDVAHPPGKNWSEWTMYVFVRRAVLDHK